MDDPRFLADQRCFYKATDPKWVRDQFENFDLTDAKTANIEQWNESSIGNLKHILAVSDCKALRKMCREGLFLFINFVKEKKRFPKAFVTKGLFDFPYFSSTL